MLGANVASNSTAKLALLLTPATLLKSKLMPLRKLPELALGMVNTVAWSHTGVAAMLSKV